VTTPPPDQTPAPVDQGDGDPPLGGAETVADTYCYGHPNRPTRLRCSRCDRYICGSCAIPASVGQHCPECVAEARKSAPRVRTAMAVNAPAVRAIIVVTVGVYVIQTLTGNDPVLSRFAAYSGAIADGELYRLITSMFLHAPLNARFGILHIAFNMYILSAYGPQVEQSLGTKRFVFAYFATGFVASALSYNLHECVFGYGASGAVFGVVGLLGIYLYNRRTSMLAAHYLRGIGFFVVVNLMLGFAVAGVDNFAHIGGLLAGAALGLGFDRGTSSQATAPVRVQVATAAAVLGAGVLLVATRTPVPFC
jgi:membrane associated rhomboid family serine protease